MHRSALVLYQISAKAASIFCFPGAQQSAQVLAMASMLAALPAGADIADATVEGPDFVDSAVGSVIDAVKVWQDLLSSPGPPR